MLGDLANIVPQLRPLAVEVGALKLDPDNAREHNRQSIEGVKASLAEFQQRKPIVVRRDPSDGSLVAVEAGNGTLTAVRELGWSHVAAVIVEETDARGKAYALADNRTAERSRWADTAVDILEALKTDLPDIDFDAMGLDDGWAETIRIPDVSQYTHPDDEETEKPPKEHAPPAVIEAKIARGDVVKLGRHRLMCGDSFSAEDLDTLLGDVRVDAVVTDPPYAIFGSSSGISESIADNKMVLPFFRGLARSILPRVKTFGHVYTHCDWRSWTSIATTYSEVGLTLKNMIVWDKGDGGLGGMYGNAHELVAFHVVQPRQKAMSGKVTGQRPVYGKPNIFRASRPSGADRLHNAAKPVAFESWLIESSTDPGETVLDLFGGSGTTLIAAEETGRTCYMMEVDPANATIIIDRWNRRISGVETTG